MNQLTRVLPLFLAFVFIFSSCQETTVVPKPRGYPRLDLPERVMGEFEEDYCNFTFKKPNYLISVQDTTFFDKRPESSCWFNLEIPALNGSIHWTYKEINAENKLTDLVNDAYTFANKHTSKADFIDESFIALPGKVYCRMLEIEGDVASPVQFYITDSTDHFLRGSLYFNTQPNRDSLAPAVDYIAEDIRNIVNTFKWK